MLEFETVSASKRANTVIWVSVHDENSGLANVTDAAKDKANTTPKLKAQIIR